MYKGYQEEMFKNPWGVNEGFKHLQEKLEELLPMMGRCEFPNSKNKHLEKFRRAQKMLPMTFSTMVFVTTKDFSKISMVGLLVIDLTSYANRMTWSYWEDRVEEVLTPIIIAAAKEQGVK